MRENQAEIEDLPVFPEQKILHLVRENQAEIEDLPVFPEQKIHNSVQEKQTEIGKNLLVFLKINLLIKEKQKLLHLKEQEKESHRPEIMVFMHNAAFFNIILQS